MAYGKKRYYKRRGIPYGYRRAGRYARIGFSNPAPKQKGFGWGFNQVMKYAKSALSIANSTRKLLNVEYKYVDRGATQIADNSAIGQNPASATECTLNPIEMGDDVNQRNGRSVLAKRVAGSFDVYYNSAYTGTQCIRYMILLTKDYDGAGPDMSRVFEDINSFNTFRNREYPYDSTILKQGRIQVDSTHPMKHIKFDIPLGFHMKFIDNGATYASISRNGLDFVIFCDVASGANPPKITKFQSRFSYIDN